MGNVVQLVGPHRVVQLFGVKLVGVNAENGKKLLFSIVFVLCVMLLGRLLRWLAHRNAWDAAGKRFAFWTHQGISIVIAVILVLGLISLWFNNPATLTTAAGMVTAGLAFALQKVVTAFAGYPMWVQARQYTGRIVRVTNAVIFDEPVYNYTREFPYIWEEMRLPIPYSADRNRAEQILLDAARKHTTKIAEISQEALREFERRYVVRRSDLDPKVFWRLTDNWIEMAVRFTVPDTGIREIKSQMSRDILEELDRAGIGIASGTYQVVGMPPIEVQMIPADTTSANDGAKAGLQSAS